MTLPTRSDGGIDWDKVYPDWDHTSRFITINLAKEAVAHTRERCAKCAEGVTYPYPTKESEDYRRGYHDGASDVVDIIRKMED